ncbi:Protein-ADP-ribose hydrolase [bioreactor metagenome]|uniref:Protein-ADP-ribose hydrolase n=1 Tax=bioreactor metagenome TaxID=1076179 RepID=A0A645AM11_9ZZZZ
MNKDERLNYIIDELINENVRYKNIEIPKEYDNKVKLLRSLMNIREPKALSKEFLEIQDVFLKERAKERGVVKLSDIESIPTNDKISIYQGDITRLQVDAIVNAANSQLLGCFVPCHGCIDNIIHFCSGLQLREECNQLMKKQGHPEETGKAKITSAYNLPSKYVIHTVGPIVYDKLTSKLESDLESCYKSILECAVENNIRSLAFCCISTGEFHFPNRRAAEIAVSTVREFLKANEDKFDRIIFNVFKDIDEDIYKQLLN